MKVAIILLSLVCFSHSAPQPRQFHDHFNEFMEVIVAEAGEELSRLMDQYSQFEEFTTTLNYLRTNNFRNLVDEMEHLPEFNAVVEFLENDNIDILFFIDSFNEMLESIAVDGGRSRSRRDPSGRDVNSYIQDVTATFPQASLAALFDHKMANDAAFSTAITNLQSDEWDQVFGAFWNSDTFQRERDILLENGLDLSLVLTEVKAVFGQ